MEEKKNALYTEQVEDAHLRDQPNYAHSSNSTVDVDVNANKDNYGHNDTFGESEANQVNIEGKKKKKTTLFCPLLTLY